MEIGPGSRRTGLLWPSWRRRTNYLQGALMFIMFAVQFQWGFSERNESLGAGTLYGAWDKTKYKIREGCSRVRSQITPDGFIHWPESDPVFEFCCCDDDKLAIFTNFSHGELGPGLMPTKYYDLGLIDQCLPYWRCWHLFDRMYDQNLRYVYCEVTDTRKLYERRFFRDTVLKRGLLQSALPLILISEILVVLSIGLYRLIRRRRPRANESRGVRIEASKSWLRNMHKRVLVDWAHLCLLAIIGNGLIDAVGRQELYQAQGKAFYNYGLLYIFLTILVVFSSVLHQIAFWIAEVDEAIASATSLTPPQTPKPAQLEKKIGLSDDWKWQPIAAQLAILFSLLSFLIFPGDSSAAAVLGIVVAAACPWSGLYASKVIVQTVVWLLARVYQNPFDRRRH